MAAHLDAVGCFSYLFFLAAFGFYAYARIGHTVTGHWSGGLVFYEVLILLAEAMVFLSSALYGLCQVRFQVSKAVLVICFILRNR